MITIQVTPGEAMDRLSILCVKLSNGPSQWAERLQTEIDSLTSNIKKVYRKPAKFDEHLANLIAINTALWALEDEMASNIDNEKLGGTISKQNKNRSSAKKDIDVYFSVLPELKQYGSVEQ